MNFFSESLFENTPLICRSVGSHQESTRNPGKHSPQRMMIK